jgi:hypothetical protein
MKYDSDPPSEDFRKLMGFGFLLGSILCYFLAPLLIGFLIYINIFMGFEWKDIFIGIIMACVAFYAGRVSYGYYQAFGLPAKVDIEENESDDSVDK